MVDEILTIRKRNAKNRKGAKFAKEYYSENGTYPSLAQINAHKSLTTEELAAITLSREAFVLVKDGEAMDEIVAPEVINNTAEQEEAAREIVNTLIDGDKNVVIENSTINNFTIPSEVSVIANITGEFADGATIVSESTKAFTLNNTSDVPVSISIEAKNTVYLSGKFENVYINGKSLGAASGKYAEISGEVTFAPEVDENASVSAAFQEGSSVKYLNSKKLTIGNTNPEATVEVYAPNASVEVSGKYNELTATVSDSTLVLKSGFHAEKINLKKGRIMFYGESIEEFVTEPLDPEVIAVPYTIDITAANYSKMVSNCGVYNIVEDIELSGKNLSFGMFANGTYRYNLNGHSFALGRSGYASIYLRGTNPTVNVYGEGKLINNSESYGMWVSSTGATINVYGGDFEAYTHVLYAEKGTINIYGGTFKLLGNYEKDADGKAKFLLNCYDANYTAGTARINVYGGKFYNFNPAESYGEPGAPVSFVAEGYGVKEYEENGERVFEVIPLN